MAYLLFIPLTLQALNLEGDYYVPGTSLEMGDGVWKEIQARCQQKELWSKANLFFNMEFVQPFQIITCSPFLNP